MMDTRKAIWLLCFPWFLSCHAKEDPKSACDSAPCQNGAQCIDVTYPGGPLAFKCSCKEGFDGLTCQKRIDLCADEPCQNGGVCTQRGEHYHCACPEGFHGKNCETSAVKKDPCAEKPCGPHGICEVVNSQVSCECLQGFTGPKCETAEKTETVVSVPTTSELSEESWVIRDILIAMLFFVVLFAAILFFVCCHCYRVWNQRSALKAVQEAQRASGKDPGPVVGWVDLSNQMCYDVFCCCFPRQEKSNLGDRRFADPDNITGVIVPLKDYNSLIRNGYMPVCYRESPDKAKIDHMAPEVEGASMRGQPIQIHYSTEPVKYVTNGPAITREEVKAPTVPMNYERRPTMIQTIPHCQDVMDPVTEHTCEMYPEGQQNMAPQQMHCGMAPMSEPMLPEANSAQRQSYYSNTGITREPLYYNYRKPSMQDQMANSTSLDKKISRSKLYAQHGKSFMPRNSWSQSKFMDTTQEGNQMFPQSTNQNHAQSEPNLDTFPGAVYNNSTPHEPARPDFYNTGIYPIPPATPYPWIAQPFAYPYAFPYPPQNNIQDHSSSAACSTQATPREKIRKNSDRNLSNPQQKLSNGAVKGHALSRRRSVGNALCGESRMDNLQFTDDDAVESEPALIDLSDDDGRHPYVETDTDEETFDRVDDDGYGSTNRLSESDAGGRVRHSQSHREYSDETSRYYIPKKQKQRIQIYNKLHPRSSQQNSMHNAKPRPSKMSELDPCKIPLCNSEHKDPSIYHDSEGSTSEEEREDYSAFSGPAAGHNSGSRTQSESYRAQLQNGGSGPNKLMRRGDLWSGQAPKCFTPLKYVSKGDDIQLLKPTAPKKVKGILKNSSQGVNYNRSAYSLNARKIKDITVGRLSSRRRPQRYRESD